MIRLLIYFLISGSTLASCSDSKTKDPVIVELPTMGTIGNSALKSVDIPYDISKPDKKWELPDELHELSGNTMVDKDHLLLIEDARPNIYLFNIQSGKVIKTIPFEKKTKGQFDVEDVTIVNDIVYAMQSHGNIYKIENWQTKPKVKKINTFLSGKNNVEGICYDPVTKKLLLACKGESGIKDEKKSAKAVYTFDLNSEQLDDKPLLVFRPEDFEKVTGQSLKFNPSAIAIQPQTHDIYLLSTRDTKGMAVFDRNGKLKAFERIDYDLMPQPEGICFAPDGTMYISSEGASVGSGMLFRYNKKS